MKSHYKDSRQLPSGKTSGGILGLATLLAGATWCARNHTRLFGSGHKSGSRLMGGHHRGRLGALRSGHHRSGRSPLLLAAAGAGLAGLAAAGLSAGRRRNATASHGATRSDVHLSGHVVIHRTPDEVYNFWKDFRNLPEVMSFVKRVEPREGNVYHWVAGIPGGGTIEWDAETVDDQPGKLLAWRSLEGSDLQCWGTVFFQRHQNQKSTEVSVSFNFSPSDRPSQVVGEYLSTLESAVLNHNLRQLKSTLEAENKVH